MLRRKRTIAPANALRMGGNRLMALFTATVLLLCCLPLGGCAPDEGGASSSPVSAGTDSAESTTTTTAAATGGDTTVTTADTTVTTTVDTTTTEKTTMKETTTITRKPTSTTVFQPVQPATVRWDNTFFVGAWFDLGLISDEEIIRRAVRSHAEAGVNLLICFTSGRIEAFLDECAKCGVYAILNINKPNISSNIEEITEEDYKAGLARYLDHPQVIGYINYDEPWHEDPYYVVMQERQAWANKYFPNDLSFINLLPSYGPYTWGNGQWTEYVDTLVERVDPTVMCVDYYVFQQVGETADLNKAMIWRDWGYVRKKALEKNKPLWLYIQGWDFGMQSNGMTIQQLKLQMHAGLAYGSRWLCYWTSCNSVVTTDGHPSHQYEAVTQLNERVRLMGAYLFEKTPGELYHAGLAASDKSNWVLANSYYCDDVANSKVFASLPKAQLILSTYTDDSDRTYVAVVNRSTIQKATDTVALKTAYTVKQFDPDTGAEKPVGEGQSTLSVSLAAGEMALYILE